jgi:hypothetical protein
MGVHPGIGHSYVCIDIYLFYVIGCGYIRVCGTVRAHTWIYGLITSTVTATTTTTAEGTNYYGDGLPLRVTNYLMQLPINI